MLAALAGNVGVAVAKFVAFGISGSSALLTEALHSAIDSTNQVLLLIGGRRARRRQDGSHPLGYGMELYFWSFVVALLVFAAGGVASVFEGVARLRAPEPSGGLGLNLGVLAIAAALETTSLAVAYREYKAIVHPRDTSLWQFIRASKDPRQFATLLEDCAALTGIALATAGVIGSTVFHLEWADGAASIGIGLVLVAVAFVLADETRSLIAGEAVAGPTFERLRDATTRDHRVLRLENLATLQLGPKTIMVSVTARFADMNADDLSAFVDDITAALKAADDRVSYVYIRPTR